MAADTICQTPFGDFRLCRYPARRDEPLQAWCAADLLLLEEVHRLGDAGAAETLVVNDEHGALCVALQPAALWTDSALAVLALQRNLAGNRRRDVPVVWSTQGPAAGPELVVLRIPKQLPYLEYQLEILSRTMKPGTTVLAAGMDKHLSPRVADLLEQHIGPTQRHRGQRKARLFSASRDDRVPAPAATLSSYYCDDLAGDLQALPNVFSRDKLDGGSRLLLAQLPRLAPASTLLDLACGNGLLGLAAFKGGLATEVFFADESAMAVASARMNASRLFPAESSAFIFHQGDGLANYSGPPVELILCNPPFHLNHAVDEYAGRRLLEQCARHLQPGGRLCLVANRHLDYLPTLKRKFGRVERLARDRRFDVWLAERGAG
jgi:16S rRNA G1207 methylase RsmC